MMDDLNVSRSPEFLTEVPTYVTTRDNVFKQNMCLGTSTVPRYLFVYLIIRNDDY